MPSGNSAKPFWEMHVKCYFQIHQMNIVISLQRVFKINKKVAPERRQPLSF